MVRFEIGDLVRVKGCAMTMCVEEIDPPANKEPFLSIVRTIWFDYVGALHRDGFDPRCLERAFIQQAGHTLVPLVPHQGVVR